MAKKIYFVIVVMCAITFVSGCGAYNSDGTTDIKGAIIDITVLYDNLNKKCLGTAVYADGYILSTAHSFTDTYKNTYISSYCTINQTKYVLSIIAVNTDLDLVLLKCNYNFSSVILYDNSILNKGDKLFLAADNIKSHAMYEAKVICPSQIIDYSSYKRELMSISVNAGYGDSGAPLVDKKGNTVGILCAKLIDENNIYFAIKGAAITKFLESV